MKDRFPITWESPRDAQLFWTRQRMHFPDPVPALEFSLNRRTYEPGMAAACRAYGMPLRGVLARRFNTYAYSAMVPVPPEEMAAASERAQESLGTAMGRLGELWSEELLPEVLDHIRAWDDFALRKASMKDLLAHLEDTVARSTRLWEIHMLAIFPCFLAISRFEETYRDLFPEEGSLDAMRLLQGLPNKTVETGQELWRLSRKARASREVGQALEHPASEVIARLEGSEAGRDFLGELRTYLDRYGQRADLFNTVSAPTWVEDPTPAIESLQAHVSQPDREDPALQAARLAAEREEAVESARRRLSDYPRPVKETFEFLVGAAQAGSTILEDHGFYIDYCAYYRIRLVLLELARRLVEAGALERPEDLFMLTLDEVRETAAARPGADLSELVAARRAELERFRDVAEPETIGTPPPGPPPDDPILRAFGKFFGGPVEPAPDPGVVRGHPGSAGKVSGTARVLRSISEGSRMEPGEVLVAVTTAPPWTPLFARAAAVVTDVGGILSHAALLAREYGIPAVIGTGRATSVIGDGDTVEVDGNEGLVRIVR